MICLEVNNKNYPIFKSRQTEMERLVIPVDIKMENLEEADKFLEVQSPKTELGRNKKCQQTNYQ